MSAIQSPPTTRSSSPLRKRRRDPSRSPSREHHRSPKTPRLSYPKFPPPKFWDELSEVPLTRNALRELERRNSKLVQHSSPTRAPHGRSQSDSLNQTADEYVSQCSSTLLDQIKRFALHGGPDLRDLRGYDLQSNQEEMSASQSSSRGRKRSSQASSSRKTATTKNTGPYDRAFAQHLIDHNIFPDNYEYPDGQLPPEPDNVNEIRQALSRRRPSLSPSRFPSDNFRRFRRADSHAAKERQITSGVIPIIAGDAGDLKCVAGEAPFTNLQALTDGTLVAGNPDLYYGARPEQLDQKVRRELSRYIAPSTERDRPILPNFCLAVKGIGGTMDVALRQACYDGTLGARAMQKLQSYGISESGYDNKAYTLTSIYHAGMLRFYTIHPIETPGEKPGFAMTLVKAIALVDGPDAFRDGIAAFRNGRDWAKEQRDDAIKQANERAALIPNTLPDNMADGDHVSPLSFDSNTSADELSIDVRPPVKRPKPNDP